MEKTWCIYKHTNTINKKVYIGQTCQQPQRRWGNGLSQYIHNNHFCAAIKKYGWENFNHEILIDNLKAQDEANYWQCFYINYYDSKNPQKGYNLAQGGKSSPFNELWQNENFRKQQSQRQSAFMKEQMKDPLKKQHLRKVAKQYWENNDQARQKQSQRMTARLKQQWEDNEYREKQSKRFKKYLQQHKEEQREHSRQNALNNWQNENFRKKICKKIKNIETGLIFESAAAAARWCGLADRSSITKHLTQHTKSAGKHPDSKIPLHWEYVSEEEVI